MTIEQAHELGKLQSEVQHAMWEVHHITGRSDQGVPEICALHPGHDAVKKYKDAQAAFDQFVKGIAP